MSDIKIVSDRTIVKKITIGTPTPAVKTINIQTTIAQALDVEVDPLKTGDVLIYNETTGKWKATNVLELQIIDGGEGF